MWYLPQRIALRQPRVRRCDVLVWGCIVLVWGILYVFWVREYGDQIISDGNWYINVARHLYHDGVYSFGELHGDGVLLPTSRFPPVYVGVILLNFWLFGDTAVALEAVRLIMFVLAIVTIVYTYRIGCLWNRPIGYAAAAIAVLDVHMLAVAMNYDLPDFAVAFFTTVGIFHFLRAVRTTTQSLHDVVLAAVFLGVAMWTKVSAVLLWVPLLLVLVGYLLRHRGFTHRRKMLHVGIFLSIVLAFFVGWKVRNWYAVGSSSFTSQSGEVLLHYHAGHTLARLRGTPDAARAIEAELAALRPPNAPESLTTVALDDYQRTVARQILLAHPFTYLTVKVLDVPNLFLGTLPPYYFFPRAQVEDILQMINTGIVAGHLPLLRAFWADGRYLYLAIYASLKLFIVALLLAASIGAVRMARERSSTWMLATMLLVIAYVTYVSTPVADPRYRSIAMPFLYVLAAYGLCVFHARVRSGRGVREDPSSSTIDHA